MWTEIDRDEGVWTIPATRMKAKREQRVPLCRRAIEILDAARTPGDGGNPLLFPSVQQGKQLSDMMLSGLLKDLRIAPCRTVSVPVSGTGRPRRRIIPER